MVQQCATLSQMKKHQQALSISKKANLIAKRIISKTYQIILKLESQIDYMDNQETSEYFPPENKSLEEKILFTQVLVKKAKLIVKELL